jgi:RimJ/RimL family protein N-acetyltransferase
VPRPERLRASALRRPLETARLRLEPLGPGHAQQPFFEGLRDPELYRYETEQPPADLEALRARFTQLADGSGDQAEVWLNWVCVRREGAAALGYVQATVDVARASATIGYLVLTAYQRRGYGRQAVAAMCDILRRTASARCTPGSTCGIRHRSCWRRHSVSSAWPPAAPTT